MKKQFNYNFMPTLKEMAFNRISAALCKKPGILNFISEFQFINEIWWTEDRMSCVSQILSNLRLPESLKKQMIPKINAVADEILRCKLFYQEYLDSDICAFVLRKLRWTTAGTVNYRETAKELVRCDILDAVTRFQLSCFYCLEDYISILWKELSDEDKKAFYDGDVSQIQEPHLQLFLPNIFENGESRLGHLRFSYFMHNGPLNNAFERAAAVGNKTLTDYYLRKLPVTKREDSLVQAARNVIRHRNAIRLDMSTISFIKGRLLSEVACHLLSMTTAEHEKGILKELPGEVLGCFLDWPYQDLFLDFADIIWTLLSESEYEGLLFLLGSPVNFRKCFLDQICRSGSLFMDVLINEKDTETIEILLRDLGTEDRAKCIFTQCRSFLIHNPVTRWPAVEVFLREATLTKEQKQRLKEVLTQYAERRRGLELEKDRNYRRLFDLVDEGNSDA